MKKRLISSLLLALMLIMTVLPMASASSIMSGASTMFDPMYVSTGNKGSVNLRAAPSLDAPVITTIPYAAQVHGFNPYDNSWASLTYNGFTGYAMSRYFTQLKPSAGGGGTQPAAVDLYKNFVKVDYYVSVTPSTPSGFVNCRWAPSKTQGIQTTYYAGQRLRVIAQDNTWAQVYDENNHVSGFMMRAFLTNAYSGIGDGATIQ